MSTVATSQPGPVRSLFLLAALLVLCVGTANGQSRIQGTVQDAKDGASIPNAHVFLQGTTHGTATDSDGHFRLTGIQPGSYQLVVSAVGYAKTQKSVQLYAPAGGSEDTSRTLSIELPRKVVELEGVSVEANRDEWLDRLDEFRSIFLGDVPQADDCEFINPEVLSLEETDDGIEANAKEPLRIRNEALGYEITFHMSRFVASRESRHRYGHYEFDTLQAENSEQRQEWMEARAKTYRGSFRHFVQALASGTVTDEGFRMGLSSSPRVRRGAHRATRIRPTSVDRHEIFEPAPSPNRSILTIPNNNVLEVEYVREGEAYQFAREYRRRSPHPSQTSWVQIIGGSNVLVDTDSGDFVASGVPGFGHYFLSGYWGWSETGATVLPSDYAPPDRQ